MNDIKLRKIILIGICLVYALMFILPFGESYSPACDCWLANYLINDVVYLFIFIPFPVLLISYLMRKRTKFIDLVKLLQLLLVGFYFLLGLSNIVMISQDFTPSLGAVLPSAFLPLIFGLYMIDWKMNSQ